MEQQDTSSGSDFDGTGSRDRRIRESMGLDEAMTAAFENLPCWRLDVDSNGVVTSVAIDPTQTQFGRVIGKNLADLFDPRAGQLIRDTLADAGQKAERVEMMVATSAGEKCRLQIEAGTSSPLTCKVSNLSLKRRMKDRIAKLQSLEAASLVASQVAHDINNKLTIVTGNLSLLEFSIEDADVDDADECLTKADEAIVETKVSVGKLRTLAKAFELTSESLDMRQLTEKVVAEYRSCGCNCNISIPDELHIVEGDRHLLTLALNHLLLNAWEAAGNEGIDITICDLPNADEFGTMLPEGPAVLIRVEDNGPGIAEDISRRIYQPFFTTKPDSEGIGLSIVRAIARRHNAVIRSISNTGGGCFELLLPATGETEAYIPAKVEKNELQVLILDDDPSILQVTTEMLQILGHAAIQAKDSASAVAALRAGEESGQKVGLVLIDMLIEGDVGGVEALCRLREIQPDVPAIACSGQITHPAVSNPASFGFNAGLCKPYSLQQLQAALKSSRD